MKTVTPFVLAAAVLATSLAAQKIPLPEGDRIVQVFDVRDLLRTVTAAAGTPMSESPLARVVEFVRAFAGPQFGKETDVQALGQDHLVALGLPEHVAAVEQLLEHLRKRADAHFQLNVRIHRLTDAVFERVLDAKLAAIAPTADAPRVAVLGADEATAIAVALRAEHKADRNEPQQLEILQAPQIVTPSLRRALIRIGEEISYVRDFDLDAVKAAFIANPIVDSVWDGLQVDATVASVGKEHIGIQLDVLEQRVAKPIRTLTSTVPGSTLTVETQVPQMSGCRGSQTAMVPTGGVAIVAARRKGGGWLVVISTVHEITFEKPR